MRSCTIRIRTAEKSTVYAVAGAFYIFWLWIFFFLFFFLWSVGGVLYLFYYIIVYHSPSNPKHIWNWKGTLSIGLEDALGIVLLFVIRMLYEHAIRTV